MKNTYTVTFPSMSTCAYETRELTYGQAIEVLRDIMKVTAERAKATLYRMEEDKIYAYGNALRIMKNK